MSCVQNALSISNADFELGASQRKTLTGWTLGAGVDYAATVNLIARLEYRYTGFGSKDFYAAMTGSNFCFLQRLKPAIPALVLHTSSDLI